MKGRPESQGRGTGRRETGSRNSRRRLGCCQGCEAQREACTLPARHFQGNSGPPAAPVPRARLGPVGSRPTPAG